MKVYHFFAVIFSVFLSNMSIADSRPAVNVAPIVTQSNPIVNKPPVNVPSPKGTPSSYNCNTILNTEYPRCPEKSSIPCEDHCEYLYCMNDLYDQALNNVNRKCAPRDYNCSGKFWAECESGQKNCKLSGACKAKLIRMVPTTRPE
jgi:hypothetical protein